MPLHTADDRLHLFLGLTFLGLPMVGLSFLGGETTRRNTTGPAY